MSFEVRIYDPATGRSSASRVGELDRELERLTGTTGVPRWVQRDISDEARKLAREAAEKLLSMPTRGEEHTGLRAEIASGISVTETESGAKIESKVDEEDEKFIPRGLDDERGWMHPVFGNRNVWVRQHGRFGWWSDTMDGARERIRDKIGDTINEEVRDIARRFP